MYKSTERGVAVPTAVSVNNYVQNFSPLLENDVFLKVGDVAKM